MNLLANKTIQRATTSSTFMQPFLNSTYLVRINSASNLAKEKLSEFVQSTLSFWQPSVKKTSAQSIKIGGLSLKQSQPLVRPRDRYYIGTDNY